MWIAAALQGFWGMPASALPRLMSKRRMRFRASERPTREKEMVLALVRDILQEEAADDVLADAWAAREAKDQDNGKSVLDDPSALDKLEVSLDADHYEVIKESTMARHARRSAIASSKKAQGTDKSKAPATALPGPTAPSVEGADPACGCPPSRRHWPIERRMAVGPSQRGSGDWPSFSIHPFDMHPEHEHSWQLLILGRQCLWPPQRTMGTGSFGCARSHCVHRRSRLLDSESLSDSRMPLHVATV